LKINYLQSKLFIMYANFLSQIEAATAKEELNAADLRRQIETAAFDGEINKEQAAALLLALEEADENLPDYSYLNQLDAEQSRAEKRACGHA